MFSSGFCWIVTLVTGVWIWPIAAPLTPPAPFT